MYVHVQQKEYVKMGKIVTVSNLKKTLHYLKKMEYETPVMQCGRE